MYGVIAVVDTDNDAHLITSLPYYIKVENGKLENKLKTVWKNKKFPQPTRISCGEIKNILKTAEKIENFLEKS